MPASPIHHPKLIINLDRDDFPGLITGSKGIQTKYATNVATFSGCTPSPAVLLTQITNLESCQVIVTTTKAKGATGPRNLARDTLWTSLNSIVAGAQVLVDGNVSEAQNYADLLGVGIAKVPVRNKPVLEVLLTSTPGMVLCRANGKLLIASGKGKAKGRTYLWRYSINGGTSWVSVDGTPGVTVEIPNLPLNTTILFQVCAKDSGGQGAWCQSVSLFVH